MEGAARRPPALRCLPPARPGSGAIAHRAEEVFERGLSEAERQAAQRLLIRMVRPGEGVEDTRQRAAMPEADPVAEATIRKLADARLVVTERDAATGRETVEVAHEALIRGWQRLRGWVDQDREFLRTRERIAAQARLWEDEGQPPDRLLPPAGRWRKARTCSRPAAPIWNRCWSSTSRHLRRRPGRRSARPDGQASSCVWRA